MAKNYDITPWKDNVAIKNHSFKNYIKMNIGLSG